VKRRDLRRAMAPLTLTLSPRAQSTHSTDRAGGEGIRAFRALRENESPSPLGEMGSVFFERPQKSDPLSPRALDELGALGRGGRGLG